jgi:hypothetical protein
MNEGAPKDVSKRSFLKSLAAAGATGALAGIAPKSKAGEQEPAIEELRTLLKEIQPAREQLNEAADFWAVMHTWVEQNYREHDLRLVDSVEHLRQLHAAVEKAANAVSNCIVESNLLTEKMQNLSKENVQAVATHAKKFRNQWEALQAFSDEARSKPFFEAYVEKIRGESRA